MNPLKAAPKKLVAKASAKRRSAAKAKPRPQMTVALAEKYAIGSKDGRKIDTVAFLRTLRQTRSVTYYADTSWWLNFHIQDDAHHQAAVDLFVRDENAQVFWTPWQRVEVFNSLHQLERKGDLEAGDAKRLIRRLEMEVRLGYWLHREFSWTDAVRRACQLAQQHGPALSIRGMDLFHVAVALTVRAPVFLSFDTDQNALARAAGLNAA